MSPNNGVVLKPDISTFLSCTRAAIKEVMPVVIAAAGACADFVRTKRDGSMVTVTDQRVEQHLHSSLSAALPGIPVLGEEGAIDLSDVEEGGEGNFYSSYMQASHQIIIDPIDGTKNFVEGNSRYCIAAALSERVRGGIWPVAAVVSVPTESAIYWSDEVWVYREEITQGRVEQVVPTASEESLVSVNSRDRAWINQERLQLLRPWVSSGSSIYDLLQTAWGRQRASIVGSQRLWDLMPPLAIALRLGLVLRDLRTGEEIHQIVEADLSDDYVGRPWGLNRRFILAKPELDISSVVGNL